MPTSLNEQQLFKCLKQLDIHVTTHEHVPLFKVKEAEKAKDAVYGTQTKNLFLKDDKKQFWLIVAYAYTQINLREVAKQINAPKLRFAQADLLEHYLGLTPGSVTPFGLINDVGQSVRVLLDAHLFDHKTLGFHPLRNDATTLISPADLKKFVDSCGNECQIFDFQAS